MQMSEQAIPKKQILSEYKDDVIEESLSDDAGNEIHGDYDKEEKL